MHKLSDLCIYRVIIHNISRDIIFIMIERIFVDFFLLTAPCMILICFVGPRAGPIYSLHIRDHVS